MYRLALCLVALTACGFRISGSAPGDDTDAATLDPPWWNEDWSQRARLVVTPGPLRPDKGYERYTVRYVGPVSASATCEDVRIATWDGTAWTERARHVVACAPELDVRFALPADIADGDTYRDAFLYWGNASAPAPARADGEAVYLWWDPATTDRTADYVHGRMDAWLVTAHDDSLAWNAAGYYTYDTGNDSQSSYRRAVDERDVLVEASTFHTGCYPENYQSGVCARGVILSGTGGSELSNHYYCSSRAQNPNCGNGDQGIYDGDIVATDNEMIALQGLDDPPPIVPSTWRTQALAVFGVAPTQLRFWDADTPWPTIATPPASAIQATGAATIEHPMRGFAGIMTAQDAARVKDLVIRRYVEPEPAVTVEPVEMRR